MHGVGKNLLELLRNDSSLIPLTVQLIVAGERRLVLIPNDAYLIYVVELIFGAELANVLLDALIARLDDVAGHFKVAVDHQALVGHVCVDADFPLVKDGVLRDAALPTAQIYVTLELTRIGSSHDNSFARMTDDWVVAGVGVRVKADDELKVPLLGIGSTLFAHVVACRFGEVQSTDGDLPDLSVLQVDATSDKLHKLSVAKLIKLLTAPDKTAFSIDPIVIVQCELSERASPT